MSSRITVESCLKLAKPGAIKGPQGKLSWSRNGQNPFAVIDYTFNDHTMGISYTIEGKEYHETIELLSRLIPLSQGVRWFYRCPECGGKFDCLYKPSNTAPFRCRKCYNLTYKSCNTYVRHLILAMKWLDKIDQGRELTEWQSKQILKVISKI